MTSTSIVPYLFFGGNCEEAIEFYTQALGAKLEMLMRFSESPEPVPEGLLQDGFQNKVMHSSLRIGDVVLYASDGCNDKSAFAGFRLALNVATAEEATRFFNALAEGGTVEMPLVQTFWSPLYGQVTDKFKLGWMVMVEQPMPS